MRERTAPKSVTGNRSTNGALLRFVLLPTIFLTVALTGGLRVGAVTRALLFIPPPLITLLLAVLLLLLFARGQLIELRDWFSSALTPLTNLSHALTLCALFFASAQCFNSVLPEAGLLRWMFSFFFLWTLWNNLFSNFDARRLLRSLAILFATAFVLKHMLLASLYAPDGGWMKSLASALLEGATLGALSAPAFAPSTGYISFFTVALFVAGLVLLMSSNNMTAEPEERSAARAEDLVSLYWRLLPDERTRVRDALLSGESATQGDDRVEVVVRADDERKLNP